MLPALIELRDDQQRAIVNIPDGLRLDIEIGFSIAYLLFYLALRKNGVPAELHVCEKGPHGVGLAQHLGVLSTWPQRLEAWMQGRGLLRR